MIFLCKSGGGASGVVISKEQAEKSQLIGCGSIEVYPAETRPYDLLKKWFDFIKRKAVVIALHVVRELGSFGKH